MQQIGDRRRGSRLRSRVVLSVLTLGIWAIGTMPAAADDATEARQLVEKARFTVENFMADPNMDALRDLIKKAKGVFIAPQLLRGAFVVGASGGSGVFLARSDKDGTWGGPTFHTVGGVSFGLQIGAEASEVLLLAMTDRGVTAMLGNNIELGADAGIAVGPVGAGVSGATANLSADIISFSRSKGLYGGVSLQGAVVGIRDDWNRAYYGKAVTPANILVRREVTNPEASGLIEAVTKAAGRR